jgi:NADPH:quinone reductase-like Zn-dependent oxidoreductase
VKPGETILIHAAAGGVGLIVCQWAKHLGATVIGTVGDDDKAALAKANGCDHPINYRREDFVARVAEITGGHGADVILDIIGAGYLAKNIAALAVDGRIATIGLQQGREAQLNFGALMAKRGTIMATTLRARPPAQKASIVAAVAENVWPLVEAGQVRPVIHQELPMAQADEAHRIMTASAHTGKIVLLSPWAVEHRVTAPTR